MSRVAVSNVEDKNKNAIFSWCLLRFFLTDLSRGWNFYCNILFQKLPKSGRVCFDENMHIGRTQVAMHF